MSSRTSDSPAPGVATPPFTGFSVKSLNAAVLALARLSQSDTSLDR